MYKLDAFALSDMLSCATAIRQIGIDCESGEETAEKIVRYIYNNFSSEPGEPAFSLVRLFKTFTYDELDGDLRLYARTHFENVSHSKFLVLLATAGEVAAWNDRRQSKSHRLIPLSDSALLYSKSPIIAHLLEQFGLLQPGVCGDRYIVEPDQKTFNVFYVPEASECSFMPAQDFVREFAIRSVLGFGSMLQRDSFFCTALFARVFVPREVAQLFNPLALSTKNSLIQSVDFRPPVAAAHRKLA